MNSPTIPMQVKLYADAAAAYVRRCYRHARPSCGMLHRPEWADMLRKVQGQWLTVETDYLFADQFNTVSIPGVSDSGLRVLSQDVEEVRGDIRPGRYFDQWTNKNHEVIPPECHALDRQR